MKPKFQNHGPLWKIIFSFYSLSDYSRGLSPKPNILRCFFWEGTKLLSAWDAVIMRFKRKSASNLNYNFDYEIVWSVLNAPWWFWTGFKSLKQKSGLFISLTTPDILADLSKACESPVLLDPGGENCYKPPSGDFGAFSPNTSPEADTGQLRLSSIPTFSSTYLIRLPKRSILPFSLLHLPFLVVCYVLELSSLL